MPSTSQSAISEIKVGNGAAGDKWQRSEASGVKSEATLVFAQSAIGEIKLATELQRTHGRAWRLPMSDEKRLLRPVKML